MLDSGTVSIHNHMVIIAFYFIYWVKLAIIKQWKSRIEPYTIVHALLGAYLENSKEEHGQEIVKKKKIFCFYLIIDTSK